MSRSGPGGPGAVDPDAELVDRLRHRSGSAVVRPVTGDAPLSFGQERMWLAELMRPEAGYHNCAYAIRLRGHLDPRALERAVTDIVRRHQVLRTVFARAGRTYVQRVLDVLSVPLSRRNPSAVADPVAAADRRADELAAMPYRLDRDPPVRLELVRLSDRDHMLVFCVHHVAVDGWSEAVLHRELSALYGARVAGTGSPLPDLPLQYRDYAAWQRRRAERGELGGDLRYWRDRLTGVQPLRLPFDRPPGPLTGHAGGLLAVRLSATDTAALRERARQERATLFAVLLGGFASLLAGLGGQDSVVIGVPVAGRNRPELESLIGFFVNTLALRIEAGGAPSGREMLARTGIAIRAALDHQEAPFEQVVAALRPVREPGRQPLVQALFQLHNVPAAPLRVPGLDVHIRQIFPDAVQLDLALVLVEEGNHLTGHWRYRTDLFDPDTVRLLHESLVRLLRRLATAPDRPVAERRTDLR